jgi:hypothetical protein
MPVPNNAFGGMKTHSQGEGEGRLWVDSRGSIAVPRTAAIWRKPGVRNDRSELLNRVEGV